MEESKNDVKSLAYEKFCTLTPLGEVVLLSRFTQEKHSHPADAGPEHSGGDRDAPGMPRFFAAKANDCRTGEARHEG